MAVYKPSNFYPSLEEIDVIDDNEFTCQINTSGEPIKAYKMSILSGDGEEVLFDPKNPIILENPVKNKQILGIKWDKIFTKSNNKWTFPLRRTNTMTSMTNGKDYQWGVRVYNTASAAEMAEQPNTLVCDGFLVGSTKYIVWMQLADHGEEGKNKTVADQLVYDRYIEFNTPKSKYTTDLIIGAKDTETTYPKDDTKTYYRERQKIDWVTKEIGKDKNFIKIETEKPFTYNYNDGVSFQIYQCSSEHTIKSAFADPNGNINVSQYIIIYKSKADAVKAKNAEDTPSKMTVIPAACMVTSDKRDETPSLTNTKARKMVGYSSDTGEIRISDSFVVPPENGQCYRIFSYNGATEVYTAVDDDNIETHIIGGVPIEDTNFKVCSNKLANSNGKSITRLFIQPNINIKSDDTHPNEIVFDNGCRIDILKKTQANEIDSTKTDDITFNKLDNTQWLLEANMNVVSTAIPLDKYGHIQPQTTYKVYTDFADTIPYNIFYARETPYPKVYLKDLNTDSQLIELETVDLKTKKPEGTIQYRDVVFSVKQYWNDFTIEPPKYYKYSLYLVDEDANEELVAQSNNMYNQDMEWTFRGLDGLFEAHQYRVQIDIVNEHDKSVTAYGDFNVDYTNLTHKGISPLIIEMDCNTHSAQVEVNTPLNAFQTKGDNGARYNENPQEQIITLEQGVYTGVDITNDVMLDYTHVDNNDESALVFPQSIKFYSEFFIKEKFINELTDLFKAKIEEVKNDRSQLDRLSVEREIWSIKHQSPYTIIEKESEIPSQFVKGRVYYFENNKVAKIVNKTDLQKGFFEFGGIEPKSKAQIWVPKSESDILDDYTLTISNFEDVYWYVDEKSGVKQFIAPSNAHTFKLYKNIFDLIGDKDLNDFSEEEKEPYLVQAFDGATEYMKNIYTVYRDPRYYSNETRLLFALQNGNKYKIFHGANSITPNSPAIEDVNKKFYLDEEAATTLFQRYGSYVPDLWGAGIYRYTGESPFPWVALSEEYYLWLEDTGEIPDYNGIPDGYDEDTYTLRGLATLYQPEVYANRYDVDALSLEMPESCTPKTQWIQSPEVYLNYNKDEAIQPVISGVQYCVNKNNANIDDLTEYGGRRDNPSSRENEYEEITIDGDLAFEVHAYGTNDELTDESIDNYELYNIGDMISMFSEKEEWKEIRENTNKVNPHIIYEDTRVFWEDETEVWDKSSQSYKKQPTVFIDTNKLWKNDIKYDNAMYYYDNLGIAEVCNRLIRTTLTIDNTDEANEVVVLDIDMNNRIGTNRGRS